ncbi:MAG: phosphorylase family protein, partial [Candidatus Dormibacteria bacterium]
MATSSAPQVVIFTALRLEFNALASKLTSSAPVPGRGGKAGWLPVGSGRRVCVAVIEIGRGNLDAAVITAGVLEELKPEFAIFSGIGMTIKDVVPGDVVAGLTVVQYAPVKADRKRYSRRKTWDAGTVLREMARQVMHDNAWRRRLPAPYRGQARNAAVEPIASGDALIKYLGSAESKWLAEAASDCIALDMEGAGFMRAAKEKEVPALVVRGISDAGHDKDGRDSAGGQEEAAAVAAAFVTELISRLPPAAPAGGAAPPWPPAVLDELDLIRAYTPDIASRVEQSFARQLHPRDPRLAKLIENPPFWLTSARPEVWLLLAHLASAYDSAPAAARAFRVAVDGGIQPQSRWLATAALWSFDAEPDLTRELLAEAAAGAGEDDPFIELIQGHLSHDPQRVLQAWARLEADDPEAEILADTCAAWARDQAGDLEAGNALIRRLTEKYPERSGPWISAGQFMLKRSYSNSPTRAQDILQGVECFLKARDIRRPWNGDSASPTAMAAAALFDRGDYLAALDLTLPPPRGQATEWEAKQSVVAEQATRALLIEGRLDEAQFTLQLIADPHARAIHEGLLAKRYGGPHIDGPVRAFRQALATASNPVQRFVALYHLATLGQDVTEEIVALRVEDPEKADHVQAELHAARGEHDEAIAILQPRAAYSLSGAEALAHVQLGADLHQKAAATLEEAAERWDAPNLLLEAIDVVGPRYPEDVRRLAEKALQVLESGSKLRRQVLARLLRIEGQDGAWDGVIKHARTLLHDLDPTDPEAERVRWALVIAHLQRSERPEALKAMETPTLLDPQDVTQAHAQIHILGRERPGPASAAHMRSLAEKFGDEETGALAWTTIYTMGSRDELPHSQLARLHAATAAWFNRNPSNKFLKQIPVSPDDPDQALAQLDKYVPAFNPALDDAEEKVNKGMLPVGFLGAVLHRPYMTALITKGGITAFDPTTLAAEMDVCLSAIGKEIVIDGSTVYLSVLSERWWNPLLTRFGKVQIADLSVRDMLLARDDLAMKSTLNHGRGPDGKLELRVTSDEVTEIRAARAAAALKRALGLRQTRVKSLDHIGKYDLVDFGAWIGGLEIAAAKNLPLMCDDAALRGLAAQHGIATFSTLAFVNVMRGLVPAMSADAEAWTLDLMRAAVTDFPFSEEALEALCAESGYRSGAAMWAFGRLKTWLVPDRALAFFQRAVEKIPDDEPLLLGEWLTAGLAGVPTIVPEKVLHFVVSMLLRAWRATSLQPEALPILVKAVDDAKTGLARSNVLVALTRTMDAALEGLDSSARLRYFIGRFEHLETEDRATALRPFL